MKPAITLRRLIFLLAILGIAAPSASAVDPVNTTFFGNLAVDGYDPVAYFTDKKPVKGNKKFEYKWMDANWRFVSQAHLDQFRKDPEKYAPQYGGYCAWAVSQGYTAEIDPDAWKIVDGKLYLNYDKDVQEKWEKDVPGFIEKANKSWPEILKE